MSDHSPVPQLAPSPAARPASATDAAALPPDRSALAPPRSLLSRLRVPPVVWPLLLSALAWWVIFTTVPPQRQEFPLHDDWAFARGAFAFYRGEGIHYFQWASMPQLGQWLWAMPFIAVLGESHVALRLSTIVLGWVALLAFYDLLRQAGVSKGQSAFAMAVLAFNPWFFLSQGTFMTDVPSLAFALGALALYGRALSQRSLTLLVGAVVVALLGAITRQNTVAVGLAAAVFLAFQPALRRRPLWWLGVLLPAAVAAGVHAWFQQRSDIRPMPLSWPTGFHTMYVAWVIVHTLGLIAVPVLLLDLHLITWKLEPAVKPHSSPMGSVLAQRVVLRLDQRSIAWTRFAPALVLLLLAAYTWRQHPLALNFGGLFPYTEGVLDTKGVFSYGLTAGLRDRLLTPDICLYLSVAGAVGAAVLLGRPLGRLWEGGLLLLFSLIQLPLLLILPKLYDRYLEFLMPAGLYLATTTRPVSLGRWLSGGAALALSAVISVGLMHDWLAWNGARWTLGRRAIAAGIDPHDIEGGFEWDGWFAPSPLPPRGGAPPRQHKFHDIFYSREFSHVRGYYGISFSMLTATVAIDTQPYELWLQPGPQKMFLLTPVAARQRRW